MAMKHCVVWLFCLGVVSLSACQKQPAGAPGGSTEVSAGGKSTGGPVGGPPVGPIAGPPSQPVSPPVGMPTGGPVGVKTNMPSGAPGGGGAATGGQPQSLTGSIKGRPFQPDTTRISQEKGKLKVVFAKFSKEETFFPESAITVDIPIPGSGWEGATLEFGKNHPGSPTLRLTTPKPGSSFGDEDFVSDRSYSLRLTFDRRQGTQVSGRVELQVADPPGTSLVGNFLGVFQPSLTEPPTEADRPYVTGLCRLPEDGNEVTVTAKLYGMGPLVAVQKGAELLFENRVFKGTLWQGKSPHQTSIWFDPEKQIRYKHTSLVPGEYLVVLKLGKVWGAWQKVTVEAGSELQLDLSMEATSVGKLTFNLPEDQQGSRSLFGAQLPSVIPLELGFTDQLDTFDFTVYGEHDSAKPLTIPAVKAGRYLVRWRKCEAEVEVKPGEETTVTLMPKP